VEDQISAAQSRDIRAKKELTSLEAEQRTLREGFLLEKARLVREMQKATRRRYLVLLERALAHVESELKKLEPEDLDGS
ncbi:MAG TPA: hypothetical protein VFV34_12510, partial [Blastocatellia bacterium]|nr:hypothetical protein [Blastocatellia bacterium]